MVSDCMVKVYSEIPYDKTNDVIHPFNNWNNIGYGWLRIIFMVNLQYIKCNESDLFLKHYIAVGEKCIVYMAIE